MTYNYEGDILFLDTKRNGYGPDQCGRTLTVGDLLSILDGIDEETPVLFRNDGGYTYGSISDDQVVVE